MKFSIRTFLCILTEDDDNTQIVEAPNPHIAALQHLLHIGSNGYPGDWAALSITPLEGGELQTLYKLALFTDAEPSVEATEEQRENGMFKAIATNSLTKEQFDHIESLRHQLNRAVLDVFSGGNEPNPETDIRLS